MKIGDAMALDHMLRYFGFVEDEGRLWFSNCSFNALICIDKVTGMIKKIIKIPGMHIRARGAFFSIFKMERELILIPGNSSMIVIYNMDTDDFSSISVKRSGNATASSSYAAACRYGNEIIMFPYRGNTIVIYDHSKRKVSTIKIEDDRLNDPCTERGRWFRFQFEILDDHLYIPFMENGAILKMDLITKWMEVKWVKGLTGCDTIDRYGERFYLASWNEKMIYEVDMDLHLTGRYTGYPEGLRADRHIFAYSTLVGDKIVYFPLMGNMIVSFNLKDKKIREEMRMMSSNVDKMKTCLVKKNKEEMIVLMRDDPHLLLFFYEGGNLCRKAYSAWDDDLNRKMIKGYLADNKYFDRAHEENEVRLSVFIDVLEDPFSYGLYKRCPDSTKRAGEEIYRYISKELE